MMSVDEYTKVARSLQGEARRLGLTACAFRAPCRVAGNRSIRRTRAGQVVVHVNFVGRDPIDVTGDLIDGVLAAQSDLDAVMTETMRNALWVAAGAAIA